MINSDTENNLTIEQIVTGLKQGHYNAAFDTPLRPDAFELDDDTKMS